MKDFKCEKASEYAAEAMAEVEAAKEKAEAEILELRARLAQYEAVQGFVECCKLTGVPRLALPFDMPIYFLFLMAFRQRIPYMSWKNKSRS